MKATIVKGNCSYQVALDRPLDISIELKGNGNNLTAWYLESPQITPVKAEGFIGDVNQGAAVNFRNIYFNPHAHGTHTECVGHISKEEVNLNEALNNSFFLAQVVTIEPKQMDNGDAVITLNQVQALSLKSDIDAFVLRTLPNATNKQSRQYSNTNPPFVEAAAMGYLVEAGIDHFLIDLPSVDKEKDEGKLAAHHQFWNYPSELNKTRTITEFIYVEESIKDGIYFLNLQTANFKNDASPSRPVLFEVEKI